MTDHTYTCKCGVKITSATAEKLEIEKNIHDMMHFVAAWEVRQMNLALAAYQPTPEEFEALFKKDSEASGDQHAPQGHP